MSDLKMDVGRRDTDSGLCAHIVDRKTEGCTQRRIMGVFLDPEDNNQLAGPDLLSFFFGHKKSHIVTHFSLYFRYCWRTMSCLS